MNSSKQQQEKVFFVIFGPSASGKMTIAQELAKKTNLKVFHNHMIIDPLLSIFNFTDPHFGKLVRSIQSQVFEAVAQSNLEGIIFTFVWNFNNEQSKNSIDLWSGIFKNVGGKIYVVELVCDLDVRLERNKTDNRLFHKISKKDLEKSEAILLEQEKNWKMQSDEDFYYGDKFLRINNAHKTAVEVADLIIEYFNLESK